MHWAQRATIFKLILFFSLSSLLGFFVSMKQQQQQQQLLETYFGRYISVCFFLLCFSNLHTYDVRHISSNAWIFISFAHMVFGRQQYMNSIHRLMVVIQTGAISNCNNEWSFRTLFVSPMDSFGQPKCECKKKERNRHGNMLAMRKDTYHISHTYISPFFVRLNRFSHISISRQSVQKLLAWWCVILGPFWLRKCLLNI